MDGFIRISQYAGMREDLSQAGGGNSSYKESPDKMYIKASGFQLADVNKHNGYSVVNPMVIQDFFLMSDDINSVSDKDIDGVLRESFISGARPSIETFLHAISGKYTLHTHPIVVNAFTCRKTWLKELKALFPKACFVPYATPGAKLAKEYYKYCKEEIGSNRPVFIQNHGLVVSGDTADEVIEQTEMITSKLEDALNTDKMRPYHDMTRLWSNFEGGILWRATDRNVLSVLRDMGTWNHLFCPDCIVYLGKRPLVLNDNYTSEEINNYNIAFGKPVIIYYKNSLFIHAESVRKAMEIQSVLSFSAQVAYYNKGFECDFLSEEEQNYLLNWDAEKYRKKQ